MTKSNKLTLAIFIAMLVGIAVGAVLNSVYPAPPKKTAEQALDSVRAVLSRNADAIPLMASIDRELQVQGAVPDSVLKHVNREIKAGKAQAPLIERLTAAAKIDEPIHATLKAVVENVSILTDIFLRLIKMIIAPLVLSTLIVGVAKLGDLKSVGRIGGRAMLWFISASLMSLLLGMVLVNFFQPGITLGLPLPDASAASGVEHAEFTLRNFFTHVFPRSIVEAMANNEIHQIVIFS